MFKRNISIIRSKVENDLRGKCTTAVVADVFLNALPLDKKAIAAESAGLTKFVNNVMETLNPSTLFENAIEATKGNDKYNYFVRNLASAVENVVVNKAQDGLSRTKDIQGSAQEISDMIQMEKKDVYDLLKASKDAGTTAVSEIVKKKVVDTIRDEKAAYDEAQQTKQEVKAMLTSDTNEESGANFDETMDDAANDFVDSEDEAVESYLNLVLAPTDVRAPISFFSKLNDISLEAVMTTNENIINEIPFNTLDRIAIEMTLPYFTENKRNPMHELKSICAAASTACESACGADVNTDRNGSLALICTICVTTLIETLKTLHLLRPTVQEVSDFVASPTNVNTIVKPDGEKIASLINGIISNSNIRGMLAKQKLAGNVALGAATRHDMNIAKESLVQVKKLLNTMGDFNNKESLVTKVSSVLEQIDEVMHIEERQSPQYGHFVSVQKNDNIANVDRAITSLSRKPGISKIIVKLRSDVQSRTGLVENVEFCGVNNENTIIAYYVASINCVPELGATLVEIVRETLRYAATKNIKIDIFFNDAGYQISTTDE